MNRRHGVNGPCSRESGRLENRWGESTRLGPVVLACFCKVVSGALAVPATLWARLAPILTGFICAVRSPEPLLPSALLSARLGGFEGVPNERPPPRTRPVILD